MTNTIEVAPNDEFQLSAFPNPTASEITIRYELDRGGKVGVQLFDVNGKLVSTLAEGNRPAGENQTTFNIGQSGVPNGIYLLRVTQDGRSTTRKLMLHR